MKSNVKKIKRRIFWIVWSLIAIFILLVGLFIGVNEEFLKREFFMVGAFLALLFLVLGGVLIYLTKKAKIKGKLKWFLMMTGSSSVAFLASVLLHNFFYALTMISENIVVLKYFFEALHVIFFLIGIPASPIVFIIGAVGSILLLRRKV